MALQIKGPISLGNIQKEFRGTAPISLSEYYYDPLNSKWPTGYSKYKRLPKNEDDQLPYAGEWNVYNLSDHYKGVVDILEIIGGGGEVKIQVSTSSSGASPVTLCYFGNNDGGEGGMKTIKNIVNNKIWLNVFRTDPGTYGAYIKLGKGYDSSTDGYVSTKTNIKIPEISTPFKLNRLSNYYGAAKLSLVPLIAEPRIHSMGVGSCVDMCWYKNTTANAKWIQMNVERPKLWSTIFGGIPNTVTLFGIGREVTLKVKTSLNGAETTIYSAGDNRGDHMTKDNKTDNKALYNPAAYKKIDLNLNGDIWVYAKYNNYDGGDCEGGYIHAVACT
jgi:hypothetical protein